MTTSGTFYSDRFPVGTRVEWLREVYRMPYSKRPLDCGVVIENKGDGFIRVRPDHAPETTVRGSGVVFSHEGAAARAGQS